MLRDELNESLLTAIRDAMERTKAEIWTSLPVTVVSYDPVTQQVVVRPAIQMRVRTPENTWQNVSIGLLPPIPVKHPRAGGVTMTMPIAAGDEGTIQVSSRCIDGWYSNGAANGPQPQTDYRLHDLSDSFYLPGGSSVPRQLSDVSATSCQLRTDDGTMVLDFNPQTKVITITSPHPIVVNGELHVTGDVIAGYGGSDQVTMQNHTHSEVESGSSNTAKPNAGT